MTPRTRLWRALAAVLLTAACGAGTVDVTTSPAPTAPVHASDPPIVLDDDLSHGLGFVVAQRAALYDAAAARDAATHVHTSKSRRTQQAAPQHVYDVNWDALAACESSGDSDGVEPHVIEHNPAGFYETEFQFSPDTARKVGAYRGMPYSAAMAAAQQWASMIADPGSRQGWPTCWNLLGFPRP